ncbi:MAG: class I SAM-dependent methyltransferase [Burkholderiaceae bacterium]
MSNGISFSAIATSSRYFVSFPAVQAILIQFISFFFAFMLLPSIWLLYDIRSDNILICLLQGAIAMSLSYYRQLAPWWLPIQFIFPCALALTLSLQIPPGFFLAGFIFLLGFFWTTFRTQVPFYPSNSTVWDSIEKLLPHEKQIRVIDIGSGIGSLILTLAARRPEVTFTGIEVAPLPWLISRLRASIKKSSAHFIRGDYENQSLTGYDVVFAYLSPAAMSTLWQQATQEMKPGTLLLSYEFLIPDASPDFIISPEFRGPDLYGWRM